MYETTLMKPYLINAIYEWCNANLFTPYLSVQVNKQTLVPQAYIKDGRIVLSLSGKAVRSLRIDEAGVSFSARFNSVLHEIYVPLNAVESIFAKENGKGVFFLAKQESADTMAVEKNVDQFFYFDSEPDSEKNTRMRNYDDVKPSTPHSHLKIIK